MIHFFQISSHVWKESRTKTLNVFERDYWKSFLIFCIVLFYTNIQTWFMVNILAWYSMLFLRLSWVTVASNTVYYFCVIALQYSVFVQWLLFFSLITLLLYLVFYKKGEKFTFLFYSFNFIVVQAWAHFSFYFFLQLCSFVECATIT